MSKEQLEFGMYNTYLLNCFEDEITEAKVVGFSPNKQYVKLVDVNDKEASPFWLDIDSEILEKIN